MEEKKVSIKIVSHEGDTRLELAPQEALSEIRHLVNDEHKWCVVDGEARNVDVLSATDLAEASNVVLTDKLVGGQ